MRMLIGYDGSEPSDVAIEKICSGRVCPEIARF